jgi:hypothetical protein
MQFNSLKFCVPAKVTIPVSCGLGDNSEKINTIISQEKFDSKSQRHQVLQ